MASRVRLAGTLGRTASRRRGVALRPHRQVGTVPFFGSESEIAGGGDDGGGVGGGSGT